MGEPRDPVVLAVLLLMLRWCMGEASRALRSRPEVDADEPPDDVLVGCISWYMVAVAGDACGWARCPECGMMFS